MKKEILKKALDTNALAVGKGMGVLMGIDTDTSEKHIPTFQYKFAPNVPLENKSVNILALDQASGCGWCTQNASGVWDFTTRRDESHGMKLLRFRAKLKEVCALEDISVIVYERVAGQHKNSIIHASKMVAVIETFCEENGIEYKAVSATEVKKKATGKGNANKDAMIAAARLKYGYEGDSDDEADAIHIYHFVKEELGL